MRWNRKTLSQKINISLGARVARNPEDAHVDEFIKLVPGVYSTLLAGHTAKMSKTKLFWLQADNTGGNYHFNNKIRFVLETLEKIFSTPKCEIYN